MQNTLSVAQNDTSPNRPGLELAELNAKAPTVKREPIVRPDSQEIKGDLEVLDHLCVEITQFLHSQIGVSLTSSLLSDSRGQQ